VALTYANNTKRIVELYYRTKTAQGTSVERKLGFHQVYYADDVTGQNLIGPYVEPCPVCLHNFTTKEYPGNGKTAPEFNVIGRRYLGNAQGGGELGFWKHPCV